MDLQVPTFPVQMDEDGDLRRCHLEILSPEGLFVRVRKPRPVETEVHLALEPPDDGPPFELAGRVVRVEPASGETPAGMEIRFVGMSRDAVTRLAALLAQCEDLNEDADAEIDEISVATVLRRRVENAGVAIERAEKHLVKLERELEFARQAERASHTLVEQIEVNRSEAAHDDRLEEVERLAERRGQLQAELDRRRGGSDAHQRLERELGRVDELTRALEEARGQLAQTKESAAQRLQDAREELEAETAAREDAEAHRARLEREAGIAEPTRRAATPPPPPPDDDDETIEVSGAELTEEPEPPAPEPPPLPADAAEGEPVEDDQGPDLASAIAGELLTGSNEEPAASDEPAPAESQPVELTERSPPALRAPPKELTARHTPPRSRPSWLNLLGGAVIGGIVVVGIVLGVSTYWPDEEADDTGEVATAGATDAGDESDAGPDTSEIVSVDAISGAPIGPETEGPDEGDASDDGLGAALDEALDEPESTEASPSAEDLLAAAQDLHASHQFKLALQAYKVAEPENPRSYELHAGMGQVLLELGRTKQAITHLERATRMRPGMAKTHVYLGTAYWEDERNEDARVEFERFLELAPKSPRANEIRALLKNL